MKIHKILEIKNVGRFNKYNSNSDDLSFAETTLIFGYNTHGKSTLTSIFKSLNDGNKKNIIGRKTFESQDSQSIKILVDNTIHDYNNTKWGSLQNIEFFDNDFISKNVFYGDEISNEQQSNLYDILISEEVKQLKLNIESQKDIKRVLEHEQEVLKSQCNNSNTLAFNSYINLTEDKDISKRILDKSNNIEYLKNALKINELLEKTFFRNDFLNVITALNKTLDENVENKLNSILKQHKVDNWKNIDASNNFLNTGIELLKNDGNCVFCGQTLESHDTKELVQAFKQIFNSNYTSIKDEITIVGEKFLKIDIEKECLEFKQYGIELEIQFDKKLLLEKKSAIDGLIIKKINDLNFEVDLGENADFTFIIKEFKKLSLYLDTIKNILSEGENESKLKMDLELLKLQEFRFSEEQVKILKQFSDKKSEIEKIKKEIVDLDSLLKTAVDEIFKSNLININNNLKELGANFKISKLAPSTNHTYTNSFYCGYSFIFNNIEVKHSNKSNKNSEEPEDLPNFKNTLSDSDKRLLALAFFLSKLYNSKNLGEKIIVLDDPFSSFDGNRKGKTAQLLSDIKNLDGVKPLQVIIMTHDSSFLSILYKKFNNNIKVLSISNSDLKGSSLELFDIENVLLKEDFFKDVEFIKNAYTNSIHIDEALKKIRICLEHLLIRKYYLCYNKEDLSKGSINTLLDDAKIGNKCSVKKEILELELHTEMHDSHPIMKLNLIEKKEKLKSALKLFEKI
jgi:wobble nucleotide-excising tRNase